MLGTRKGVSSVQTLGWQARDGLPAIIAGSPKRMVGYVVSEGAVAEGIPVTGLTVPRVVSARGHSAGSVRALSWAYVIWVYRDL